MLDIVCALVGRKFAEDTEAKRARRSDGERVAFGALSALNQLHLRFARPLPMMGLCLGSLW